MHEIVNFLNTKTIIISTRSYQVHVIFILIYLTIIYVVLFSRALTYEYHPAVAELKPKVSINLPADLVRTRRARLGGVTQLKLEVLLKGTGDDTNIFDELFKLRR